jgi:zinc finger protein
MQNGENTGAPLFGTIGAGAEEVDNLNNDGGQTQHLVDEIESMCINCEENVCTKSSQLTQGTTRLLLTKIPFFREVILMSFSCPHCGTLSRYWFDFRIQ